MKNKGFHRLWHTRVVAISPTHGLARAQARNSAKSVSDEYPILLVTGGGREPYEVPGFASLACDLSEDLTRRQTSRPFIPRWIFALTPQSRRLASRSRVLYRLGSDGSDQT